VFYWQECCCLSQSYSALCKTTSAYPLGHEATRSVTVANVPAQSLCCEDLPDSVRIL
jgi:hypothetical protein